LKKVTGKMKNQNIDRFTNSAHNSNILKSNLKVAGCRKQESRRNENEVRKQQKIDL
jgi:hypothetical protein